jgi:hypothetical protein
MPAMVGSNETRNGADMSACVCGTRRQYTTLQPTPTLSTLNVTVSTIIPFIGNVDAVSVACSVDGTNRRLVTLVGLDTSPLSTGGGCTVGGVPVFDVSIA